MTMRFNEKTFVPLPTTNWRSIACNEALSEEFIEIYGNYLNWTNISLHQKMSRNFIFEHMCILDPHNLFLNRHLSKKLKKEIKMWFKIRLSNDESYFDFLRKIQDRLNAI